MAPGADTSAGGVFHWRSRGQLAWVLQSGAVNETAAGHAGQSIEWLVAEPY